MASSAASAGSNGDTYDTVVAIFVQFADPPMRGRLFANMARSLRHGSLLLLQGCTPKQLEFKNGGPPILSHLYTKEMLRTAFAAQRSISSSCSSTMGSCPKARSIVADLR